MLRAEGSWCRVSTGKCGDDLPVGGGWWSLVVAMSVLPHPHFRSPSINVCKLFNGWRTEELPRTKYSLSSSSDYYALIDDTETGGTTRFIAIDAPSLLLIQRHQRHPSTIAIPSPCLPELSMTLP